MKKRLILKVLGLLLLLPMFSGCNDTDDVAGIFTGKTWKLTYITSKIAIKCLIFGETTTKPANKA